jgi:predicted secreted protein
MINKHTIVVFTGLIFFFSINTGAHENETLFNVVNLQAQAEHEVPNDQMTAILATEHEGKDATAIAKRVNEDMQWALDIITQHTFAESRTTNYQTYPVYNKQVIIGWRTSQQVEVKSTSIEGLSELVGKLQSKLQVKQMYFSPTDIIRKKYEDQLIEEAMQVFKHRVAVVKKHMDDKDYRIINININTGSYQPPVPYGGRMKAMAMEVAEPAVEAGTSKITVTVNGSVQFF